MSNGGRSQRLTCIAAASSKSQNGSKVHIDQIQPLYPICLCAFPRHLVILRLILRNEGSIKQHLIFLVIYAVLREDGCGDYWRHRFHWVEISAETCGWYECPSSNCG